MCKIQVHTYPMPLLGPPTQTKRWGCWSRELWQARHCQTEHSNIHFQKEFLHSLASIKCGMGYIFITNMNCRKKISGVYRCKREQGELTQKCANHWLVHHPTPQIIFNLLLFSLLENSRIATDPIPSWNRQHINRGQHVDKPGT